MSIAPHNPKGAVLIVVKHSLTARAARNKRQVNSFVRATYGAVVVPSV